MFSNTLIRAYLNAPYMHQWRGHVGTEQAYLTIVIGLASSLVHLVPPRGFSLAIFKPKSSAYLLFVCVCYMYSSLCFCFRLPSTGHLC
jgi:hypothetical protein